MAPLHAPDPGLDPLTGKVLEDRYRIVRKLGEGGMGAVYEGEHLLIKKRVAIKVLHPQFATSVDIVTRFHHEALAATAIGHPNIVEVNDLGRTSDGGVFMVLELLSGRDFAALIEQEGPLTIGRAVHILMQVCDAVQAAHDKGIIHRDLKPENIFLVGRGGDPDFAKVLDFGISKIRNADISDGASGGHANTRTGSVIGTAYYMSPEQAQGKRSLDHRTDVWALGAVLFRALTGTYPFHDDSYTMLLMRICSEDAPALRSLRPDAPAALETILRRCLERTVEARVGSCAELRELLRPFESIREAPPRGPSDALARTLPASDGGLPTPVSPARHSVESGASEALTSSGIRARSRTGTLAVLTVAIVSLALATLAWRTAWPATPTPTAPESVEPSPERAPPVTTVSPRIEFIVSPVDAIVLVDGRPLDRAPNGSFTTPVVPEDRGLHELRIEGRGFRSRIEDLRLSYAQRIVLSLDAGTGEDDRRASHTAAAAPAPDRPAPRGRRPSPTTEHAAGAPPLLTTEEP